MLKIPKSLKPNTEKFLTQYSQGETPKPVMEMCVAIAY